MNNVKWYIIAGAVLGVLGATLVEPVEEATHDEDAEDSESDGRAIALDRLSEELWWDGLTDEPPQECQHDIPRSCTEGRIEEELTQRHARQACGDRDELADTRH